MSLTDEELERYARQVVMPEIGEAGQKILLDAHITIIGAGGLGAPVIMALAGAGAGHLTLIDDDNVSVTDLNRQFIHTTSTIGINKTESAMIFATSLNPDIKITPVTQRLEADNAEALLARADVVIDCSDTPQTRYIINASCLALRVPLIFGGAVRTDGQVTSFLPENPQSPCLKCLFPMADVDLAQAPSCAQAGILGPTTLVIGALQAAEAIRILLGMGENLCGKLLLYDGMNASFTVFTAPRNPDCPACRHYP